MPQNPIFLKTEKIIQNTKTQKRLEICQNQRYALRPEVSNPSGSGVSGSPKIILLCQSLCQRPGARGGCPSRFPGGPRIPKNPIFLKNRRIIQNAKTQKRLEICQSQQYAFRPEVSNPSGSVVSGWTKNTQKPKNFEKRKKSFKTQKLKNVQRYAKISDTPFDQRSLIHREVWFPPCFVTQNQQKKKTFFARHLLTIFKQKCSNLRPLLSITFPQGFQISKNIGHLTLGSGGKKTFKRYLKSEHTDGQTDGQTHRRTDTQTDRHTDGHFDLQKASTKSID